jgi:hypothetical protein
LLPIRQAAWSPGDGACTESIPLVPGPSA